MASQFSRDAFDIQHQTECFDILTGKLIFPNSAAITINGIRFPDQYSGSTATAKQDAAIAGLSGASGTLFNTTSLSCGIPTSIPNNVLIWDFRQCEDIVPGSPTGSTTRPQRPQVFLMKQQLGEYDEIPLTGTFTFTDGSTAVSGTGTAFSTELSTTTYLQPVIRLSSASTATCWAPLATITDDNNLVLVSNLPAGCGGTGAAVMMRGQLGQGCQTTINGGFPNTQAMGEYSCYQAVIHRVSGNRGIYGANFSLRYDTPATASYGQAYALETDLLNASGVDDVTANNSYGIYNVSAGTNKVGTGMFVGSSKTSNLWHRGLFVSGFDSVGVGIQNTDTGVTHPALQAFPNATDLLTFNPSICTLNAGFTGCLASLNYDGSATLTGDLFMNGTSSTNQINLTGKSAGTTNVLVASQTGDSIARLQITANGSINEGSGSAVTDSQIHRTGVGIWTVTTTINPTTTYQMNSVLVNNSTAPTLTGFGTSPSIVSSNGNVAFEINVGTGGTASTGTINFPTAAHGWAVHCDDVTTKSTAVATTKQTSVSTTSAGLTQYSDVMVATAWGASDHLVCEAHAY